MFLCLPIVEGARIEIVFCRQPIGIEPFHPRQIPSPIATVDLWSQFPRGAHGTMYAAFWTCVVSYDDEYPKVVARRQFSKAAEDRWMLSSARSVFCGQGCHHLLSEIVPSELTAAIRSQCWLTQAGQQRVKCHVVRTNIIMMGPWRRLLADLTWYLSKQPCPESNCDIRKVKDPCSFSSQPLS